MTKKILIAHQSTIPHYRVDFYNAVEAIRPKSWTFDVVFDHTEITSKRFFKESVDETRFQFPVVDVRSFTIRYGEKKFTYQNFFRKAGGYELIIVGSALSNIIYPICSLHKLRGKKYAIWGHGRDHSVSHPSGFKSIIEKTRCLLAHNSDGFFAYTQSIKDYLIGKGVSDNKIFVLNNTIDIIKQRQYYQKYLPNREEIKRKLGLEGKKVLLFVGRFTENKKIDFLLETFQILLNSDSAFYLVMIGSGSQKYKDKNYKQILFFDSIIEPDVLASFFVASEIYVYPGSVGLGPLQALCYDLPVITIDSETHGPEFAYLSNSNSLILPKNTAASGFAEQLLNFYSDKETFSSVKSGVWSSITHLTIDKMATSFVQGVNKTLQS